MSHPAGTYLGGIRTLEDIRLRCRIDDETGCWIWSLGAVEGFPRIELQPLGGKRRRVTGTTAIAILKTGAKPGKGMVAYCACCVNLCVNPEHVAVGTRAQHGAHITKSGRWKGSPARLKANRKNVRNRASTKLSIHKAREIRASPLTEMELSRIYGVPASQIGSIRRGRAWREGAVNSSIFNLAASL